MISAELFWPLIGFFLGSLLGAGGIGLVRLFTRNKSEGWFIAGADVVAVLLLILSALAVFAASLIINTKAIGLNHAESYGFILGACAFDAGALVGMLGSLISEISRRRELSGAPPLMLALRSLRPVRSSSSD